MSISWDNYALYSKSGGGVAKFSCDYYAYRHKTPVTLACDTPILPIHLPHSIFLPNSSSYASSCSAARFFPCQVTRLSSVADETIKDAIVVELQNIEPRQTPIVLLGDLLLGSVQAGKVALLALKIQSLSNEPLDLSSSTSPWQTLCL
jgi:hypothetical protein